MMADPVRIAMWSGPRNISTAMLRSWENRADTFVCDEPLYAHYLVSKPDLDHPGRDEVIAHHESDWRKVVAELTGPIPRGKGVYYQKHMAHHLLDDVGRDWLDRLTHCFLIRDPEEMITSLIKHLPEPTLRDTGLPQQVEIARFVRERTGGVPPIVDAKDVLDDPRSMLGALCHAVGVPFSDEMLSWPAGTRETVGIWAKHWYAAVENSTGFKPYKPKGERVPPKFAGLLAECQGHYDELFAQRLQP